MDKKVPRWKELAGELEGDHLYSAHLFLSAWVMIFFFFLDGGHMAQLVECLSGMHEAMASVPTIA